MSRHRVCAVSELPRGGRKIVEIGGKSIGIFNVDGEFRAVLNVCPHELAPVCLGTLSGTTAASRPGDYPYERDGRILRCPWHGWEFDVTSGACLVDKRKLKTFRVVVEGDDVFVEG